VIANDDPITAQLDGLLSVMDRLDALDEERSPTGQSLPFLDEAVELRESKVSIGWVEDRDYDADDGIFSQV
jgi:hypothetical protein